MKKILRHTLRYIITHVLIIEARLVLWRYAPKIVVITGTVGKTSTKDAIAAVFASFTHIRKSEKSFNSEIGLPLTILGLPNAWGSLSGWMSNVVKGARMIVATKYYPKWLIIEIGTDRPGDVSRVARWLKPNIVVATRFAEIPVHVEFFNSPEDVIKEEQSIAYALEENGVLVTNNDDPISVRLRDELQVSGVSFGMSEKAGVYASHVEILSNELGPKGMRFRVNHGESSIPVTIHNALGVQHIYPVIAAIAAGMSQGLNLVKLGQVFESYETPKGRMRLIEGKDNTVLIDDTYNSSPVAAEQALLVLKETQPKGKRIAVLGDMKELGVYTEKEHLRIGKIAAECADVLIFVGAYTESFMRGATASGAAQNAIYTCLDVESAKDIIQKVIDQGDTVLIKGSQSIRLEKVTETLMKYPEQAKNLLVRQENEWKKR